jgi:molybdopterin-guanine dinucleotide biosynthesis protein A
MTKLQNITGVILAGGTNSRMGADKALLLLKGLPFIQRIAGVLKEVFEHIVVISDHGTTYQFLGLSTYPDVEKQSGPLGGIHSALTHTDAPAIFVVGCDTPYVTAGLIRYICDFESLDDIKIPIMNGQLQPLCAVYSRKTLKQIEENIKAGLLKVDFLLEKIHAAIIPITPNLPFYDKKLLTNINTAKDYEAFVTSR